MERKTTPSRIRLILLCLVPFMSCGQNDSCSPGDLSCDLVSAILFARAAAPTFAYSSNPGGGSVTEYTINVNSGELTAGGFVVQPNTATLAVHANGAVLYSANGASGITVYSMNASTGALTLLFTQPGSFSQILPDSQARFGYVLTNTPTIETYTLSSTGAMSLVSSTPYSNQANIAALHSNGRFLYLAGTGQVQTFSVNSVTGATGLLQSLALANSNGVGVDPQGRFVYVANQSTVLNVYRINADGTLSAIGTAPTGGFNSFVCPTPDGRFVYTTNQTGLDVTALAVTSSGLSFIENRSLGTGPIGCGVEPRSRFVYFNAPATGLMYPFKINLLSGALTPLPTANGGPGAQYIGIGYRSAY